MELKAKITPTFADQVAQNGGLPAWAQAGGLQAFQQIPAQAQVVELPKEEVPPVQQVKPLKVALVGTAPSSRNLAPFHDPSWTIWACSPGNMGALPSADAWFELHDNLDWPEFRGAYGEKYIGWLKTLSIPVFMHGQRLVPTAKTFPKDEVIAYFGKRANCFFTSSFAWMMAYAIMSGAKEIALFGIDMASPGEYSTQRQGFYYWLEKAEDRGIKVWAPYESDIMTAPALYGYDEVTQEGRKQMARWQEIKDRIAQGQQIIKQKEAELEQAKDFVKHLNGACEDMEYHVLIRMSGNHLTPAVK